MVGGRQGAQGTGEGIRVEHVGLQGVAECPLAGEQSAVRRTCWARLIMNVVRPGLVSAIDCTIRWARGCPTSPADRRVAIHGEAATLCNRLHSFSCRLPQLTRLWTRSLSILPPYRGLRPIASSRTRLGPFRAPFWLLASVKTTVMTTPPVRDFANRNSATAPMKDVSERILG
jgi:hypothetical protein